MRWTIRTAISGVALWAAAFAAPTLAQIVPGSAAALEPKLSEAFAAKGSDYEPRTHLFDAAGSPKYLNRLILETSPYLVQHAHNPVDWRPWGPEALADAKAQGKLIFLSVGYATCHWCHVMEEESFDTEIVAEILNRDFIAIKVDREQRPDVDQTYMLATQLITQRGGWPNSVWLTPDGEPFYAGTYFPQEAFMDLLNAVSETWVDDRAAVLDQAGQLTDAIRRILTAQVAAATVDAATREKAMQALFIQHNDFDGGFSQATQFPQEVYLHFLLDYWRRTGSEPALAAALKTLDGIEAGAIHDQVGGGFHRYSVDVNWRTPHFEKMLYNQALLGRAFTEAYAATDNPRYARAARRAFDYVMRDMTAPDGGFYAAEDADSLGLEGTPFDGERVEGAFYVWSPEQVAEILGAEAVAAIETLGLDQAPTLESGATAHLEPETDVDFSTLDPLLNQLLAARAERPRPLRDDKIIAGWNGLMIRAFAEAAVALDEPRYLDAARRSAEAIWRKLWNAETGRLQRLYVGERVADLPGKLDDYAWMGLAFVALADASGAAQDHERATLLADALAAKFDDGAGRLKLAEVDGPIGPTYENDDGSVPAADSSALELFAQLSKRTESFDYEDKALGLLAAISGPMAASPTIRTTALVATAILEDGESGLDRPVARGKVRLSARREGDRAVIGLAFADGWHVNAHQTLRDELIPTALVGDGVVSVQYPEAIERTLGFADAPVAILEGDGEIVARLADNGPALVTLTLQACSDNVCLAPEDAVFRLP